MSLENQSAAQFGFKLNASEIRIYAAGTTNKASQFTHY